MESSDWITTMMQEIRINIGREYSRYVAGRKISHGPFSGEGFRDKFLVEPLKRGKKVIVELDDTAGYGSSFLEEAFGGLVRVGGFNFDQLKKQLTFESEDTALVNEIWHYIQRESQRLSSHG